MSLIGSAEWPLWSTTAQLVVTDPTRLGEAQDLLTGWLQQIDDAANRFRDDSEINTLPVGETVQVGSVLAMLLERALHAARITEGLVDPTVGTALEDEGYDKDIELVIAEGRPVRGIVRPVPGWRRVLLDGDRLRVPAGTVLDLGATAKAIAADTGAGLVARRLGVGALLSLGGDVSVAGPAPVGGWHVVLEDAVGAADAHLSVFSGGLATSSTVKRSWRVGDAVAHHIIDPRTGRSADSAFRSVSVIAPTCLHANAFSTAAIACGASGLEWLAQRGLTARCVTHDGDVVRTPGWVKGAAA